MNIQCKKTKRIPDVIELSGYTWIPAYSDICNELYTCFYKDTRPVPNGTYSSDRAVALAQAAEYLAKTEV